MANSCDPGAAILNQVSVEEALYLKMVEASPDAKIAIDSQGTIRIFNARAERLFGRDRSEVIGQPIEILLPESLRVIHKSHVADYMDDPTTREMGAGRVLNGLKKNGREFAVQISLAPIVVPIGGLHAMAVVRAIKRQKAADQADGE